MKLFQDFDHSDNVQAELRDSMLNSMVESMSFFSDMYREEDWRDTISNELHVFLRQEIIMPKIAAEIESWSTWCTGETAMKQWLPLIEHLPDCFYDQIQNKMQKLSAYNLVLWKDRLNESQVNIFCESYLLPKLKSIMDEVQITPPVENQKSVRNFRNLMEYSEFVPKGMMVDFLDNNFFGKWKNVLRHWLQAYKPPRGEVTDWIEGWSAQFTVRLHEEIHLVDHFDKARNYNK